jgi:hypothetical protein
MLRDSFCGYYAVISQGNSNEFGGDTLAPDSKNQEAKNDALKIVNDLKGNVVIPYLKNFKIYWTEKNGTESFKKILNG